MYIREKSVHLNSSASCLNNNLSVLVGKSSTIIAVVHRSSVMLYMISSDGKNVNQRQVMCKEPHGGQGGPPMITMAKLLNCAGQGFLVITSTRGMQVYDADGSAMVHWHSLRSEKSGDDAADADSKFMRGIASVGNNVLCVGTHSGQICLFSVKKSASGVCVTLTAQMDGHSQSITTMDSHGEWLASGDEMGGIRLWQLMGDKLVAKGCISESADPNNCWPVNALRLTANAAAVVAGYGSGLLRVFDARSGKLQVEATAHGRMITSVDLADDWLVTVSEDTICRTWQLQRSPEGTFSLQHVYSEPINDQLLIGCHFMGPSPDRLCLTAFESNELIMMKRK